MSSSDRAERLLLLRRALARIENGPRAARVALSDAFDRRLGGGLAGDGLHEIAPAAPADAGAALGFALGLAARFMAARGASGLLAFEDVAIAQEGAPFGPGLAAHGLDLARLVFVRAPNASALFQTLEDALRSGALAVVVGEVRRLAKYDLAVSRRLTLAARAGPTPALLALPTAQGVSTAAETRFEIAAAASGRDGARDGARNRGLSRPIPGAATVAARLVKARGGGDGVAQTLIWRAEEQVFEPAISVPLAAALADRPRQKSGRA